MAIQGLNPPITLGEFESFHGPEEWDGRRLVGTGIGGIEWFQIEYHINHAGAAGGILAPYDLEYAPPPPPPIDRLTWQWDGDETTIDGFRIYLNDSLQWTVDRGIRSTSLPAAWINPPCDETYRFHVTAYEGPLGVGIESISSDPVVFEGDPCDDVWYVTFDQTRFTSLTADFPFFAGPLYGDFWANTVDPVSFNSGPPLGVNILNMGFYYSILDMFFNQYGICWDCPSNNSLRVPLQGGDLTVGANLWDDDPSPNPDDPICDDSKLISSGVLVDGLEDYIECTTPHGVGRVYFTVNEAPTAGVVPGAGPGLPDLSVVNTWVSGGGQFYVRVQNVGTVPVVGWDLEVHLEHSADGDLGTRIIPGLTLEPGATEDLTHPLWVGLGDPADITVTLDPNNALPEVSKDNNTYGGLDRLFLGFLSSTPQNTRTFNVNYNYHSDHGLIQIQATPLYLGAPVEGLDTAADGPFINGDDTAQVTISYTGGPDDAYTDEMRLEMVDIAADVVFYSKTYSALRIWTP
jgi:hypothetical protein